MINMQSIRLGIIFDQTLKSGGGYHQALNSALLTKKLPKEVLQRRRAIDGFGE